MPGKRSIISSDCNGNQTVFESVASASTKLNISTAMIQKVLSGKCQGSYSKNDGTYYQFVYEVEKEVKKVAPKSNTTDVDVIKMINDLKNKLEKVEKKVISLESEIKILKSNKPVISEVTIEKVKTIEPIVEEKVEVIEPIKKPVKKISKKIIKEEAQKLIINNQEDYERLIKNDPKYIAAQLYYEQKNIITNGTKNNQSIKDLENNISEKEKEISEAKILIDKTDEELILANDESKKIHDADEKLRESTEEVQKTKLYNNKIQKMFKKKLKI